MRPAGPAFALRLEQLGGDPGAEPLRYSRTPPATRRALAALRERRRRDIERAATGAGPHLDDFELNESGRELRRFGSQGEQRRALLALILAEADLLTEERGEQPVLLLDDVTGEFDAARRSLLLDAVSRFQQAIVTTTDEADLGVAAGLGGRTWRRVRCGYERSASGSAPTASSAAVRRS